MSLKKLLKSIRILDLIGIQPFFQLEHIILGKIIIGILLMEYLFHQLESGVFLNLRKELMYLVRLMCCFQIKRNLTANTTKKWFMVQES